VKRYITLYIYFIKFSFSRALEFRLDFFFRIIMDIIYYIVQFTFFKILYLHTNTIGDWNFDQIKIFISGFILLDAINMTFFSNNTWWLPIYINKGMLDFYLTKPVSSFFFLTMRDFAANSFFNLLIAFGIFIYQFNVTTLNFSLIDVILYFLLIFNGAIVYNLIHIILLTPSFWTSSARGFNELFYSMTHIMERPDQIYKGWIRLVFTFIVPFIIMTSLPARILFNENPLYHLSIIVLMTVVFWTLTLFLWNRGLRAYSSASS
jgi:ABC-2 type transport system permease protein